MNSQLFNEYVYMPTSEEKWMAECEGFIENCEFPCIGACDGFRIHVSTHLKNYYNFKIRYTVTNMAFMGYNKRCLVLTAGATSSTHDARLLRCTKNFKDFIAGDAIPDKVMKLSDEFVEISLVTIRDFYKCIPMFCMVIKCLMKTPKSQRNVIIMKKFAVQELLLKAAMVC